ncbi:transcriptional regulator [Streptomyces africanus]|uniref:transcriptional regulator n=1 Tax=Streptomyces africanus TaxID=231024 RepID=UPI000A3C2E64|nr:transcriptional regulator [Streptomyces africanus]
MAARPLVARQPNERLQALIQEAGCSNAGLARRVNMCGAEHGLDLRYDKTSVARWLRGQQPRGRAPAIIAEALGRKLGRTVTIDEIGMANGKNLASGVGLQFSPTVLGAIEQVCELWRSDVGRRDFLSGSSVAASALVEPSRDWLISAPDGQVARSAGPRVGQSDVQAVRAMTQALVDLDHQYGSGHVRPVVVHYLNSVVSGLLAGSYREAVGRDLFAAVARLTELAGYMAVDTGQPGLAQRYYIQALRLAQAAGDRTYGAYVLVTMSRQAVYLGHGREAVQLARVAQQGVGTSAPPVVQALLHASEARGHGVLGEVRACTAALVRAERALETARSGDDVPYWATFFDEAQLADEFGHCHRDLQQFRAAAQHAERSLQLRAPSYARSRLFCRVVLATARLGLGELDQACQLAAEAAGQAAEMRSVRAVEYVRDFERRLEPYKDAAPVRTYRDKVAALL